MRGGISIMRVLTTSVSAADFPHFKFQTYSIYSFSIMLILPTVFQDCVKDSKRSLIMSRTGGGGCGSRVNHDGVEIFLPGSNCVVIISNKAPVIAY